MREDEVPQDKGVIGDNYRVNYALDKEGKYKLVKSSGCDSVNVANEQAWSVIHQQVAEVKNRIKLGELSPIAYFMTINQMDVKILSQLVNMMGLRIRRHLKPRIFSKLPQPILQKYASAFNISLEELKSFSCQD
ncbi:hypothetical protein KJ966_01965 [bacterium]|nr:hypothetical protein [bacterium]